MTPWPYHLRNGSEDSFCHLSICLSLPFKSWSWSFLLFQSVWLCYLDFFDKQSLGRRSLPCVSTSPGEWTDLLVISKEQTVASPIGIPLPAWGYKKIVPSILDAHRRVLTPFWVTRTRGSPVLSSRMPFWGEAHVVSWGPGVSTSVFCQQSLTKNHSSELRSQFFSPVLGCTLVRNSEPESLSRATSRFLDHARKLWDNTHLLSLADELRNNLLLSNR